jgi:hypothetical protein
VSIDEQRQEMRERKGEDTKKENCRRREDEWVWVGEGTWRESTVVASKWAKVVAGAGSVKSSAGTYTACTDVMEPTPVDVMRSCRGRHQQGKAKAGRGRK